MSIMINDLKIEYLVRMEQELGDKFDDYLKALEDTEKHGLVLNLKKLFNSTISMEDILSVFEAKCVFKNEGFAYIIYDKDKLAKNGVFVGKHPLHHAGLYYIQEPSAAKPVCEFPINESDSVIDLCASPGGKSIEALCCLNKDKGGFLFANEIDYSRSKILVSNIERMGFDNVIVSSNEVKDLALRFENAFDKVIIDAPCSGEGMMRKSVEARLQWSNVLVKSMASLQKEIIDSGYKLLKNGGMMLYSTCTFSRDEDENNVEYILNTYRDMSLVKSEKLYPFAFSGEGQFYAILKKNGTSDNSFALPKINSLKELNIIKYGIDEYEFKHGMKIPTHESSHVDSIGFENVYDLNFCDALRYLHGETLNVKESIKDGYYKITYKNIGLGIAKNVRGTLKNHYPKGLRNL